MKKKLGYLVSGKGRLFQKVLEFSRSKISAFEISVVIADRSCNAAEFSKKQGIPTEIIDYSNYSNKAQFHKDLSNKVEMYNPDFLLLNYNRIIKSPLLENYQNKTINIHYSILPSFKGLNSIEEAYLNGNKLIGVTAHFIDDTLDGGPIIAQNIGLVFDNDSLEDVEIAQFKRVVPLAIQCCQWFAEDKISIKNNKVKISTNSYKEANLMSPPLDLEFD